MAGDLTAADLGLVSRAEVAAQTTEVWHLGAVYDLGVAREVGMAVNLEGTRNVLRFAAELPEVVGRRVSVGRRELEFGQQAIP